MGIRGFSLAVALVIALLGSPAMANNCRDGFVSFFNLTAPDDPRALARAWLPHWERYLNAMPALSPREDEWLEGELRSGDVNRVSRASSSLEYQQRLVRRDAESLVRFGRLALDANDRNQQVRWWLRLQAALLVDVADAISVLTVQRRVSGDALPPMWKSPGGNDAAARDWIRLARMWFAADIASCTVPAVLGLPLPGTPNFER